MNEKRTGIRPDTAPAFFGRVTASVSHEINNVLAIVNEQAGLLEDLLHAVSTERELQPDRLVKASQNIQKQIRRGKQIVQRLNRFAHSIDDPLSDIVLNDILHDVVGIAQRFAYRREFDLNLQLPDESAVLTSNRFGLQQVVFAAIELAFASLREGGRVQISCDHQDDTVCIYVEGEKWREEDGNEVSLATVSALARDLGGEVELTSLHPECKSITLTLPRSMPEGHARLNGPLSTR